MPQSRLTAADRPFFAALADVVYGNAFSADRAEVIARLLPNVRPEDLNKDPEALAQAG